MLILDKQRAIDRVMALTAGRAADGADPPPASPPAAARARVASFERRAHVEPAPRRRRRTPLAPEPAAT